MRALMKLIITGLLGAAWMLQAQAADFQAVAKIFNNHCVLCHDGDAAPAGLSLHSYAAVIQGGTAGKIVIAGDPEGSELIRRVKGTSLPRMPMSGPPFLTDDQTLTLEAWIKAGMPEGERVAAAPATPALPKLGEPANYKHVAPIFARHCVQCHTDSGQMGPAPEGYRLNSYTETLSAADRVRVIPGNPGGSELLRRIKGHARPRMPFAGPPWLDAADIELVERWITEGARDANGNPAPLPVGAKVRLHGTLGSDWLLDGTPLKVGSGTRLKKNPEPGSYIRLRGRVGRDGQIEASRIQKR